MAVGACANCGHDLRAAAKFCDECGSRVHASEPAEHKQVTVLFCDVVGSMTLAATLDPERLREVMHELFNRSARIVQRFEGTVDKFTGDGLMAIFGAPVALEDHAARAAFAALEIHTATSQLADEVQRRHGIELQLRIGLNSGEVVTGDIGSDYTAIGHAVGMAQRMEAAAPAGGTLCSVTTAASIEDVAQLGPTEFVAVKNQTDPVAARRLLGISDDRRPAARERGAMQGRHAELTAMSRALTRSRHRGLVIEVVGAAGIGKSRLIHEFCATAKESGAQVVVARCESHTADLPLRALARFVRALGIAESAAVALQAPDTTRLRVLHDILEAVAALPDGSVLVLEDAHWIDDATAAVLIDLYAEWATTRALLVVSCRPDYQGKLRGNANLSVTLLPLPDTGTRSMAVDMIGAHPSVAGVPELVAAAAAGNPFFVEEIVRDLVSRGVLTGQRGDHRLPGELGDITVPASVHAAISARIDRLSAEAKTVINAAAVIGTRFSVDKLEALVPAADSAALAELVAAELIDQIELLPQRVFVFRHPLVRTVAYESQLSATRRTVHRRLAEAIQVRSADSLDENASVIAAHLDAAGDLAGAFDWHMRAADWLQVRSMNAARLSWEHARRVADRLPDDQGSLAMRIGPRMMLARTSYQSDADVAEQNYAELLELTTRSGDLLARAMGIAGFIVFLTQAGGRLPEAAEASAELVDVLERIEGNEAIRYSAYHAVIWAQFVAGQVEEAAKNAQRQRRFEEWGEARSRVFSDTVTSLIDIFSGAYARGHQRLSAATEFVNATGDVVNRAQVASFWASLSTFGFEDPEESIPLARTALAAAEDLGDPFGMSCARYALGTLLARAGGHDVESGELLVKARATIVRDRNPSIFLPYIDADLAVLESAGRPDLTIDRLRTVVADYLTRGSPYFTSVPALQLVERLAARGSDDDLREAESVIEQMEATWAGLPETPVEVLVLGARAHVARARAAGYANAARDYLDGVERFAIRGRLAEARAMVAEATQAMM